MDDVQPGKILGRRGHVWESHSREARGTGGTSDGGWQGLGYLQKALQAFQGGFVDMATPKHGKNFSIFRGGEQVQLPIEREGLLRPASQRSTTRGHVRGWVDTYSGRCCNGGPWDAGGIRGRRTSGMGPIHINGWT
jgi:hypothetical protein